MANLIPRPRRLAADTTLLAITASVLLRGAPAAPQAPRPPVQRPVTVALVDRLPAEAGRYAALVLRRGGGGDVVLLPRATASPQLLDAATRTLLHARLVFGDTATQVKGRPFRVMTLGVQPTPPPPAWTAVSEAVIRDTFERLKAAGRRPVAGVGEVPAVVFTPPSPPRRAR